MNSGIIVLIGVVFILISIIFLSSQGKKEKAMYNEILEKYNDIKEYSDTIEQIVDNLDKLIDSFLTRYNSTPMNNVKSGQSIDYRVGDSQIKNPTIITNNEYEDHVVESPKEIKNDEEVQNEDKKEDINITIKELQSQGLSNQEIAKKLGKGIREIEIITKMFKYKDSNSFN